MPVWKRDSRFNKVASSTRILVEQAIGNLKLKFPILLDHLRLHPENASRVMMVAVALHNLLLDLDGELYEDPEHLLAKMGYMEEEIDP